MVTKRMPRLRFTTSITKKNIPEFLKNIFVDLKSSFSGATHFLSHCHRYTSSVDFILVRPNNNGSTPATSLSHPSAKPKRVNKLQDKTWPMIFLHMLKTKKANVTFV